MNSGSAAKIRLVRCPNCRNVLVEPKDIPVYTCGGCSTYLRAKIRKSNPEVATSGLHETDADQKNTSAGAGSTNKEVVKDVACKLGNKTLHVAKHPGGISSKNMVRGRTEPVEEHDVENSGRLLQPGAGATSFRILEDNPSETRGAPLLSGSTRLVGQAFEENKNVIWSLLMDDEVSTIGIYGMGGAGKTTMLKHIYEEEGQRREQVISATEPISNISPNGRFRRVFTYWEKGELLGRGSFASVYEGISDDGLFFAVKEVSLLDQGTQGKQSIYQLEQEIALLSRFEHENIVQYYGTDKDESKLYIFLELVTKGSLQKLYQRYNLRDSQVSSYTRQILHGLKYLHDQKVVHRDIKCANLLVDANGSVKLADFGLAKATKLNDVNSCKGTAFWMAPEVVNNKNQGYGLSADIWSLGCTVLEMLTRQIPYSELEFMQALFKIGKGVPPLVPDSLSNDARDFILQCLQVNPNDRPTAAVLLDHPFVKKNLSTSLGSASIIEV